MVSQHKSSRSRLAVAALGAALCIPAGLVTAASTATAGVRPSAERATVKSPAARRTLQIAYLSFAVQNSYDAPMLAAARKAARADGAHLTVSDANNSPTTQYAQLQDAITSHKYQGIIVQPIFGTGLIGLVKQAIAKHIAVADLDQILGPKLGTDQPQVKGLAANVVFVPTEIGAKLGELVVHACATHSSCQVGYIYDIKASALDVALHKSFESVIKGHHNIKVVATGQSFFTPSDGLTAAQDMMQSDPNLTLIVGSDQGIEGAQQAVAGAGKTGKVILVGYGASAAALRGIKSGAWYGDVAQLPASEGRLAVQDLVNFIRTGVSAGGVDPVAQLPDGGVITKANVSQFKAEWPG